MTSFYVHDGEYLVYYGSAPVEQLPKVQAGEVLELGDIPKFYLPTDNPAGFKWSIVKQQWVDTRNEHQKKEQEAFDILARRRAAYPPLESLADALVHQSNGNNKPLEDYLVACLNVKALYPKPT